MPEDTVDLSLGEALDAGAEMAMAGRHQDAEGLFRGVLIHEPENFEAIQRLGASLIEQKKLHEALYWFWRGIKINRKSAQAHSNYGMTVGELGHVKESIESLQIAAAIDPKNAITYNNLGNSLERAGRYKEALAALDHSLSLNPLDAFPHYNRGIVLLRLNRHREAITALNESLRLDPTSADAHYNRGMARLVLGEMHEGWSDYEYRLLTTENKVPNLGLPAAKKWNGGDIAGKTILVHCEQGLGDTIQFLRYLPPLVALGAKVVLIAHKPARPLIDIPGVTVAEPGSSVPYDYWVALMSLPLWLGLTRTIPSPVPINVAPARAAKIRAELELGDGLNVGICWAGNWRHKNDANRSIPLAQFASLFATPGCNFRSFQEIRPGEIDEFTALKAKHGNLRAYWYEDLRDVAAGLLALDLFVTVDTALAHLAGTLGVSTWILIPAFSTDWRWMRERTDSPWYPSVSLIRQDRIGDWKPSLKTVAQRLGAMVQQPAASRAA